MALICDRHSFEYAENVCSSCGMAFCHDCLVYPRGPKKPPFCVNCAIAASGVRSSARNQSNLSRREVKKRVREAKGLQQPQPYVESSTPANSDRDFELTSNASFDQGWAVSWDEGRDPHPGYPEPVHVSWGNDPFATREASTDDAPPVADPPVAPSPISAPVAPPVVAAAPVAPPPEPEEPTRAPELPRLQPVELARGHAPARPGGLPSVRPPLKPAAATASAAPTAPPPGPPPLATKKLARPPQPATTPATSPTAAAPPAATAASGRLRRKAKESDGEDMLGWLDDLLGTEKGAGS